MSKSMNMPTHKSCGMSMMYRDQPIIAIGSFES
jgi:hypothetical protein